MVTMGNNCTPEKKEAGGNETYVTDTETKQALKEAEPNANLFKIIETYKQANEGMRKELEEVKSKGEQEIIAQREATQQSEKIMQELNTMKAKLAKKERALVRHQLEAALHSKASLLVNAESFAKLLKAGNLQKFNRNRKVKSAREKWVELELHNCQNTQNGFERGYMVLTYSDSKDSKLSNRCQVISVDEKGVHIGDKFKGRNFLVRTQVGGVVKELVFACEDEIVRNDWVKAFKNGFLQIEVEEKDMNKPFFVNVEFSKKELGIYVVEAFLDSKEQDLEEKQKIPDYYESTTKLKTKPSEAQGAEEAKQVDTAEAKQNVETEIVDKGLLSSEDYGQPCELLLKQITDNDLYETGLVENCVVTAINGVTIRGMSYDKQVNIITKTKKPFTLTFTGPKYLKKKAVHKTAYPGILKELVADGENPVKSAFDELIKGTTFRKELEASDDKMTAIGELLSSQTRLTTVLQNVGLQETQL